MVADGDGKGGVERGSVSGAFDRILEKSSTLYRGNPEILRENYIPPRLLHRDEEIGRVVEILSPILKGESPSNLLIYGKIGTGKTAVMTQVKNDVARRTNLPSKVTFIGVNCANVDTHYALLQTLGNSVVEEESERIPTGWSLDRVYGAMRTNFDRRGGTLMLVLDEIDRLVNRSGDDVLYSISQMNADLRDARVGIIGISNDLMFTDKLDPRIRSRLNEEKILFPPYNSRQLRDILADRVGEVFEPGVVEGAVLDRCATYAAQENGDARRALALLRVSAQIAERGGSPHISEEHVIRAKSSLESDIISACVKTLPSQCKILLWSIVTSIERRRTPLPTGEAYDSYLGLCKHLGVEPLTSRSIYNHLSDMESLGLVRSPVVSKGRGGRTREITMAVPAQETIRALEGDEVLGPVAHQRIQNQRSLLHYGTGL
jgi:cell division control protein 6